jgi:hypothetical protein
VFYEVAGSIFDQAEPFRCMQHIPQLLIKNKKEEYACLHRHTSVKLLLNNLLIHPCLEAMVLCKAFGILLVNGCTVKGHKVF